MVAAISLGSKVMAPLTIGGVPYAATEMAVDAASGFAGKKVGKIEEDLNAQVLAHTSRRTPRSPAAGDGGCGAGGYAGVVCADEESGGHDKRDGDGLLCSPRRSSYKSQVPSSCKDLRAQIEDLKTRNARFEMKLKLKLKFEI